MSLVWEYTFYMVLVLVGSVKGTSKGGHRDTREGVLGVPGYSSGVLVGKVTPGTGDYCFPSSSNPLYSSNHPWYLLLVYPHPYRLLPYLPVHTH